MELEFFDTIKKLTVIALVSDDELMETLVLKGGNALDLIYKVSFRASVDLDFSLDTEFDRDSLGVLRDKIETLLLTTFEKENYYVFDVVLNERPKPSKLKHINENLNFWGGYRIEFKLIENTKYKQYKENIVELRKRAVVLANTSTKFSIDISKYEFCRDKLPKDIEGYRVYVYSPTMIVCEKLRAICQQMREYGDIVHSSSQSERARDFFDIYFLVETLRLNLTEKNNVNLLKEIFAIKRVPLRLLELIPNYKDYHQAGFPSLRDTVSRDANLQEFEFYFDYVVSQVNLLKPFWDV